MSVFLGGLCKNSTWREKFIKRLEAEKISYYNPQVGVDEWTDEHGAAERVAQLNAKVLVFVMDDEFEECGPITQIEVDTFKELVPECVLIGSGVDIDSLIEETIKLVKTIDGCVGDKTSDAAISKMFYLYSNGRRRRNMCHCLVVSRTDFNSRVQSFKDTPYSDSFVNSLASSGFYFICDELRCNDCGLQIKFDGECEPEIIEEVHRENAPDCFYLK